MQVAQPGLLVRQPLPRPGYAVELRAPEWTLSVGEYGVRAARDGAEWLVPWSRVCWCEVEAEAAVTEPEPLTVSMAEQQAALNTSLLLQSQSASQAAFGAELSAPRTASPASADGAQGDPVTGVGLPHETKPSAAGKKGKRR